jgi:hypothetical protein
MRRCPVCSAEIEFGTSVCPTCGHDIIPGDWVPPPPPPAPRTKAGKAALAGILAFVGVLATLGLIGAVLGW